MKTLSFLSHSILLPFQAPLAFRAMLLVFGTCVYVLSATNASRITAVWANEGGDKVTQDELRATNHTENLTGKVINRTWDGHTIRLYGAHNEVISFNLVLEAAAAQASNVAVKFDTLRGPSGVSIESQHVAGRDVFSWVARPIELFSVPS